MPGGRRRLRGNASVGGTQRDDLVARRHPAVFDDGRGKGLEIGLKARRGHDYEHVGGVVPGVGERVGHASRDVRHGPRTCVVCVVTDAKSERSGEDVERLLKLWVDVEGRPWEPVVRARRLSARGRSR
jgi:hypothetical protein